MENHTYALSIYFMHYNFCRIHQTTRVTSAMAAGVTDKLWDMSDVVKIVDAFEQGELISTGRELGGSASYTSLQSPHNQLGRTRK